MSEKNTINGAVGVSTPWQNHAPAALLTLGMALLSSIPVSFPQPVYSADPSIAKAQERRVLGQVKAMGNGRVWSWMEYGSEGTPIAIGVTFTETALSGLPENLPSDVHYWEYELSLPKQAKVPPYDHIVVDWNPRGHFPPGVYDVPHFDFHFYMISSSERNKITVKKDDTTKLMKKPPAKFIPAGYILPEGTEEPRMGVHWVDPSAPEFNKQPFTKTFIYGSYDGHVTFFEPMVSLAYLKGKEPNTKETIKLPAAYERNGYYPVIYCVRHDAVRKEYTVSLEGLTQR
jgi:hypothetical protein